MPTRLPGSSLLCTLLVGLVACGQTASPAADRLQPQTIPSPTLNLSPNLTVEGITPVPGGRWVVFGTTSSRFSTSTVNRLQVYLNGTLVGSTGAAECSAPGVDCMYYKNPAGTNGGDWFAQYTSPAFWNPPVLSRTYTLTVKAYDALGSVKTVTKTVSGGNLY
jgi:hypothetical protein